VGVDYRDFRSLTVWQVGMELAASAYQLTQCLPKHELYGLSSQIQRSATSISANIAEGHARGSTRDFMRYLAIAQGSVAELQTHLLLTERLHYCPLTEVEPLLSRCVHEARMIRNLRKHLKRRLDP